jgi:hypothetical protein
MGPAFLTAYRSLVLLLALMLVGALASVWSIAQTVNAKSGEDLRYLLVRRAVTQRRTITNCRGPQIFLNPKS